MECKGVKAIFAIAAILALLVGQNSASTHSNCYDPCYAHCRWETYPPWFCKYQCTLECLVPPPAAKVDSGCSLACAKSSCGQHDNPEGIDMGACLFQCSKSCTKVTKSL
ncbi:thionin-like protein 2 [Phoenix dactylifera]|uniref:Thionin-like protein 2 n=1 Tax=Phoenix dactylifera TaxID=42345 RepID=A0A8B8ZSA9_PHODC|nr:thionin-like protein 2 [Phoenix dactylifera]